MFSLNDHNTLKAHIIAVLLKKRHNNQLIRKLAHHIVVARNDAEAFGILRFAYLEKDSSIEFELWSIFSNVLPQDIQSDINENNQGLADALVEFDT